MGAKLYISASSVLCLLGIVASQEVNVDSPKGSAPADDFSSRILNGIEVTSSLNFPHQAAVLENKRHICGGSILNDKHILTAATCVTSYGKPKSTKDIQIGAGQANLNYYYFNDSMRHEVSKIIVPEIFNATTRRANIAIVRIEDIFEFSSYLFPAQIGTLVPSDYQTTCRISGWGAVWTSPIAPDVQTLRYAFVNVTTCAGMAIPSTGAFCTSVNNGGVCESDIGGPLICEGTQRTLVGIVSHTICKANALTVCTSIPDYIDWMATAINEDLRSNSATAPRILTSILVIVLAFGAL